MTKLSDGTVFFIYLAEKDEETMPAEIIITSHQPSKKSKVTLLGTSKRLKWKKEGNGFIVTIPEGLRNNPPCKYAWTIKVTEIND